MPNFKKILIPVDLHEDAKCVTLIETAVLMARTYGAELTFMNAVDVDLDSTMLAGYESVRSSFSTIAREQLRAMIDRYLPDDLTADVWVLNGRSYSKVLEAANELGADLIIVMAHKPGMAEFLLGMTAARVVRHAECSVLVLRD